MNDLAATNDTASPRGVADRPARGPLVRWSIPISDDTLALVAVTGIFAISVIGAPGVLMFLAGTGLMVAKRPIVSMVDIARFWPLMLVPLLAITSSLWSDAPERTMRAGIQLLVTVCATIAICRRVAPRQLILITFLVNFVTCLLTLPYAPGAIASGAPMTAFFASKNALAFVSHLNLAFGLAVAIDRQQRWFFRILGIASVPLGFTLIGLAQSGGSTMSMLITFATLPVFAALGRMRAGWRVGAIMATILMLLLMLLILPDLTAMWTDFRTNVLKKDATLTGRTYLWDFAWRLNAERPLLGYGYYAFWRPGNIDAEGLWRYFGIASRSGFNFHSAFVEMIVDMGWVGAALLTATCFGIGIAAIIRLVSRPSLPMAFFLSLLAVFYLRSLGETGLIGPFSSMTMFLIATAVYAVAPPERLSLPRYRGEGAPVSGDAWTGRSSGRRFPRADFN